MDQGVLEVYIHVLQGPESIDGLLHSLNLSKPLFRLLEMDLDAGTCVPFPVSLCLQSL